MRTSITASLFLFAVGCGGSGGTSTPSHDLASGDLATSSSHDMAAAPNDMAAAADDMAMAKDDMAHIATFSADVFPLLTNEGCLSCHMTTTWDTGQVKTGQALVTYLTSTKSEECPSLPYVTPGDPSKSYLYQKVVGKGSCFTGDAMPDGSNGLPAAQANEIESWITAGATAN